MSKPPNSDDSEPQGTTSGREPNDFLEKLTALTGMDVDQYGRPKPKRKPDGTFAEGSSGNPGGIRKEVLEARRAFTFWLPEAIRRNAALLQSNDPIAASVAISRVFDRALGKASAPAELPTDDAVPDVGDTSPKALLDRAMKLKARTLAIAEQKMAGGESLSEEERRALNDDIASLSSLLKAQKDSDDGAGANLTDDELVAKVLAALPLERLQAELTKRSAP